MPIAALTDIVKTYTMGAGIVQALKGVSFAIEEGEFFAIMGPSGSGKSTLLNILGCLDRPTQGSYVLGGKDVSAMNDRELSKVRSEMLGFVFQSFNLLPQLNVLENIEVPLFYQGIHGAKARAKARLMAERVGLGERTDHRPTQLSGGQQQRVAIARALVNDPLLVLADEPTGNLDTKTGVEIMHMLHDLHEAGTTIIMVTHEDEVAQNAQKIVTVRDGLIVEIRDGLGRDAAEVGLT
ncbi:MAG: ABC transporter ATP-binding protein [Planctomycetes bacterium]|nr:ABC transporter ATP-binding protein [Planctomycetota bacterium]